MKYLSTTHETVSNKFAWYDDDILTYKGPKKTFFNVTAVSLKWARKDQSPSHLGIDVDKNMRSYGLAKPPFVRIMVMQNWRYI